MTDTVTYSKVDGPPYDWFRFEIINVDTSEKVQNVIEVNAVEGWLIRYVTNELGLFFLKDGEVARERIEGNFLLRRRTSSLT